MSFVHISKWLLFAGWLLLLAGAAFTQQVNTLSGAEEIIARANSYGAARDFPSAITLLKQALDRYPTYLPMYLCLSNWQEAAGISRLAGVNSSLERWSSITHTQLIHDPSLARDLLDTYGLAITRLPDSKLIRQRMQAMLDEDLPVSVGDNGLLALPGDPEFVTFSLSDPRLPLTERGFRQGLLTTYPLLPSAIYQHDPKYGRTAGKIDDDWTFAHMFYAYAHDTKASCWNLRFRVMWQDVPGKGEERRQFARQTAQLLLRLSEVVDAYTGLVPRFTDHGAINVWLAEKHEAGGEALNENLYLYGMDTPRSSAEWVREIAHEYGHLSLPPVTGYTQPESQATGLLGERLFVHWLLLNTAVPGTPLPWLQAMDADEFTLNRYFQIISRFTQLGPLDQALDNTNEEAMNAFVGLALYLEATRGSRFLTGVLKDMRTPAYAGKNGFRDSLENMEQYLQGTDHPMVVLNLRVLPPAVPYYVYLMNGNWNCELVGVNLQPAQLILNVDGKVIPIDLQGTFQLTNIAQGWHKVAFTSAEGTAVPELTSLKFTFAVAPGSADVNWKK